MFSERHRTGSSKTTLRSLSSRGSIAVRAVLALDSSGAPGGDALVGELDGEVVAVITIRDGTVVADPFRATGPVAGLLRRSREKFLATDER